MTEGIENNPDIWQKLFPDNERRQLVREFTEKISKINGVEVILSIPRRIEAGFDLQTIFVLVHKNTSQENCKRINADYREICPDYYLQELLGHVFVGVEDEFIKRRNLAYDLRYRTVTTLWQRPSIISKEIGYQRDFNGDLN